MTDLGDARTARPFGARAVILFLLLLLAAKCAIAASLGLFGDEAFYWQCAQRPALAYADHPFMTAMLVRLGTALAGDTPFGVRLAFLALGALVPFLVRALARPLVGDRDAWLAAGFSLLLLATAYHGTLAIPDAPLLVYATITLLFWERATRLGKRGLFVVAGFAAALGLATHYRFALVPFSIGLWHLSTARGRRELRGAGPWLGLLCMLPGLLPVLIHNIQLDFAPLRYQSMERHTGGVRWSNAGEHLALQVLACTGPFLYAAMLCVLVALIRRARRGDDRAALLACFALGHLGVFLLLSPVSDLDHTSAHWTAPGYVALLPHLPGVLREFVNARPTALRRTLAALVPASAMLILALLLVELGSGSFGSGLRRPFSAWRDAAAYARVRFPDCGTGTRLIIGDNYKLAANLDFFLHDLADVYVLDHPKNHEHGRAPQYDAWGLGEAGLAAHAGEDALLVWEVTETHSRDRRAWRAHLQDLFGALERIGELDVTLSDGSTRTFRFYHGHGLKPVAG